MIDSSTNILRVVRRIGPLLLVLVVSFAIRGLTSHFIREHLSDPGWFQSGTYQHFDTQAQDILDHRASAFWIDDPSRTESAIYPPGYPLWIALIYKLSGTRSAAAVQAVQWVLDSFAVFLVVAIASVAFSRRVAIVTGFLVALSPLLALYGVTPMADAPTSWIVLTGALLLLLAVRRERVWLALTAGMLIGISCWFRANGLLLPVFWSIGLLFVVQDWRRRLLICGAVCLGTVLVVVPLLVRNARAFHILTPTGLGVGTNLWEGIGETDRAKEFGAVFGDQASTLR